MFSPIFVLRNKALNTIKMEMNTCNDDHYMCLAFGEQGGHPKTSCGLKITETQTEANNR